MWTILFDIDCTLLRTGGAGLATIRELIHSVYGIPDLPEIEFHGRTDFAIWQEIYEKLDLAFPDDLSPMIENYCDRLQSTLGDFSGSLMTGAKDILSNLQSRPDVSVGLLTGNAKRAAMIKLKHFGLDELVNPFGGFGDRDAERDDVAAIAIQSAQQFVGDRFDLQKTWVVGDTVRDVQCARSVGAKVIAVATGNQSSEQLKQSNPDLVVNDLSDVAGIESVLTGAAIV